MGADGGEWDPAKLAALSAADFSQKVGSSFRLKLDDGPVVELRLVGVTTYSQKSEVRGQRSEQREPFSLLFGGAKELRMPQRIYRLEHAELGVLEIFLVPLQPDKDGSKFEAIFS